MADWESIFLRYSSLFGTPTAAPAENPPSPPDEEFDPEDFDATWREIFHALAADPNLTVEPGEEVMDGDRVLDLSLARVCRANDSLHLVDGDRQSADQVADALARDGHAVLKVRASDPDALDKILAQLEPKE